WTARQHSDAALCATDRVAGCARARVTGETGIGNPTPSVALIAAITGRAAAAVTGRGTGIDDGTLSTKIATVEAALARIGPNAAADLLAVLAEVGGLGVAALAGFIVGAASDP